MRRLTEADTCRKFVLPELYAAGWMDDQIGEQRTFADGRIVAVGGSDDTNSVQMLLTAGDDR